MRRVWCNRPDIAVKYSDALNEIEGILIEVIEPKINRQSGRLKSVTEYFQVTDERITEVSMHLLRDDILEVKGKLEKLADGR